MTEIAVAGTALRLMPQRAAFLPAQRLLLVADVHFGKAHAFRRLGVPVPEATTEGSLARLDTLLAATGATAIAFLGDLLHAAHGRGDATLAAVAAWRERHAGLGLLLVRGNHDRHAGDPPADWGVRVVDEPYPVPDAPGLHLAHHPQVLPGAYVLAGHVHPAVRLGGRAHQSLRLPCFHFGPRVGLLPAFGEFTGARVVERAPGDRVFAIAGDEVRPLHSAPTTHPA